MAFSVAASDNRRRSGNRWERTFVIDEVDSSGSSVDLRPYGVNSIDAIVGAVNTQSTDGVAVQKNSATLSQTEDDPGRLFVKTSSGTDDVSITVRYR